MTTRIFYDIESMRQGIGSDEKVVATMGFFDGVHLGHRALIDATKEMAIRHGAKSMIITLDSHPIRILYPDRPHPPLLSSLRRRVQLLTDAHPDYILVLPFSTEMARLSAADFLQPMIEKGLMGMMLGYDNRFGRRIEGETLEMFDSGLQSLGLQVERVTEVKSGDHIISSSAVRACLRIS